MPISKSKKLHNLEPLEKCPTGISGLDEITYGGLPKGRPTLVCGNAGCGKSLLAMEFIYRGAVEYNDPGVFITFEEKREDLIKNVTSLGFNLLELEKKKLLAIDYVKVERNEIEETGSFNLDGLFLRIGYAIDSIGAKRVVLDTIESLFAGISNHSILRAEIRRLFNWLKDKGVTVIITGEQGGGDSITRQGLEEYVSDCVIFLDHRIIEQYGTRRIRIVKYRGSIHGTNEYPFLITENGISILPISTIRLAYKSSHDRISTGIKGMDEMLGGKGLYRGTTILISGTAGTGKSSFLAHFANDSCKKEEKCLYIAFEESKDQIIRNMTSIGLNLKRWEDKGLLNFYATRPAHASLEMHLALIMKMVDEIKPQSVLFDPVSSLLNITSGMQVNSLLTRLIDFLKERNITCLMINLTSADGSLEKTEVAISSLVDTWILLRELENNGERNRAVYILKSRGMKHSNQIREFVITDNGIHTIDVIIGKEGILIGSARKAQEIMNKKQLHMKTKTRDNLNQKIKKAEEIAASKIAAINAETESFINDIKMHFEEVEVEEDFLNSVMAETSKSRQNNSGNNKKHEAKSK